MINQTNTEEKKEIDYTFTGDKAAQDFAYKLSDYIDDESWEELTNNPNKIIEFTMLLTEHLNYKQVAEMIRYLSELLAEAAEV